VVLPDPREGPSHRVEWLYGGFYDIFRHCRRYIRMLFASRCMMARKSNSVACVTISWGEMKSSPSCKCFEIRNYEHILLPFPHFTIWSLWVSPGLDNRDQFPRSSLILMTHFINLMKFNENSHFEEILFAAVRNSLKLGVFWRNGGRLLDKTNQQPWAMEFIH
jgi:hypothetical protein